MIKWSYHDWIVEFFYLFGSVIKCYLNWIEYLLIQHSKNKYHIYVLINVLSHFLNLSLRLREELYVNDRKHQPKPCSSNKYSYIFPFCKYPLNTLNKYFLNTDHKISTFETERLPWWLVYTIIWEWKVVLLKQLIANIGIEHLCDNSLYFLIRVLYLGSLKVKVNWTCFPNHGSTIPLELILICRKNYLKGKSGKCEV